MANYECIVRTNYFRVTDEERYKELCKKLSSECGCYLFEKNIDGVLHHALGSYSEIGFETDADECDYDILNSFVPELQKILPDDEAFIMLEVGNEKLKYVSGSGIVATSKKVKSVTLDDVVLDVARNMLSKDFKTNLDY